MAAMDYLPRTIEPVIKEVSEIFKVVLLTGARQCGKSTCMEHLSDDARRERLNLDDEILLTEAKDSADQFLEHHQFPIFIAEIQRAPNLFLQIKAKVDAMPSYGQVWASGSQKFTLMKGVADSLAGRICPLDLMPLSIYERAGKGLEQKPYLPSADPSKVLDSAAKEVLWKTIWQGAWPRVIDMTGRQRNFFYNSLLQTYLERDVRTEAGVEKLAEYRNFLRELALRTGQELRIGDLAKTVGVTDRTIKGWLSLAENSGLIYLLRPYYANNIAKQFVKSPKVYFTDTGELFSQNYYGLLRTANGVRFWFRFQGWLVLKNSVFGLRSGNGIASMCWMQTCPPPDRPLTLKVGRRPGRRWASRRGKKTQSDTARNKVMHLIFDMSA